MDGVDDADAGGDGPALGDRRRQSRGDDRDQRHAGPAALLPVPTLRSVAEAGPGRDRRPRPGERRMTVRSDEAAAMLADVDSVVARVKQSRLYRTAALVMILWGVVSLVRDILIALAPAWFGPRWFLIDAIGIIGTLALLRWVVAPRARLPLKTMAAFILVYAFGWIP